LTPPTTYSAIFNIDMNGSDYPNADYPSVVINGSWNGWGAWGVELSDTDEDGIFSGTLEALADNNAVEFVIAVTGESDGWSGWGVTINAPLGSECVYNPGDEYGNYGFYIAGSDYDVDYCAGTCDATCAAPPAGDPNFSATINANGGGEDYSMTFGFSPDATDGYDDGIESKGHGIVLPPTVGIDCGTKIWITCWRCRARCITSTGTIINIVI
jgi:hypothetical protein